LSRLIQTEGPGKQRERLCKAVVLAIRELMKQTSPNTETRDLAAFIALALSEITQTIERTVTPWEKRDYWVKADRFRSEWAWTSSLSERMRAAVLEDDWSQVAQIAIQTGEKLGKVQVSERHRMGTPWEGAWQALLKEQQGD